MTVKVDRSEAVFVGRTREREAFAQYLSSSPSSGPILFGIEGRAGTGKTSLMRRLADATTPQLTGYGKYDAVRTKPYEGVAAALHGLAATIAERDPDWIPNTLAVMGSSASVLGDLTPRLENRDRAAGDSEVLDSTASAHSLYHAVGVLLDTAVADFGPTTLLVDDLQWAGANTLFLLEHLAEGNAEGLVILGAWRPHERETDLTCPTVFPKAFTIGGLDGQALAELFEHLVGQEPGPETIETLEEETGGNPQFVTELVLDSIEDGTLRVNQHGQWVWDRSRASDQTGGLSGLLTKRLDALTPVDADIIASAAAIGTVFDMTELSAATAQPEKAVAAAIASRRGSAFLTTVSDASNTEPVFRFAHDRLAEVASQRLTSKQRNEVHMRLGKHLLEGKQPRLSDAMVHFGECVEIIQEPAQRAQLAKLALEAGDDARNKAAFSMALRHFRTGLELVSDEELESRLAVRAAEAAFLAQDPDIDNLISGANATAISSYSDRARLATIEMKLGLARHQTKLALERGLSVLADFDIQLPAKPSDAGTLKAVMALRKRLASYGPDGIAKLPLSEDPDAIWAEQVLGELFSTTYAASPELFPFVVVEAVNLSLDRGRLPMTPVALAAYGLLLVVLADQPLIERFRPKLAGAFYDEAYTYGEVALDLADQPRSRRYRPWTHFLFYDFIFHWSQPLTESIDRAAATQREALEVGDPAYGAYAAVVEMSQAFLIGLPFDEVAKRCAKVIEETGSGQEKQTELLRLVEQAAWNLSAVGNTDVLDMSHPDGDEASILEQEEQDPISLGVLWNVKMNTSVFSGRYGQTTNLAENVRTYASGLTATVAVPFFQALGAYGAFMGNPTDSRNKKALKDARRKLDLWAERSADYASLRDLVEGLWLVRSNKIEEAMQTLARAASRARAQKIATIEALALIAMSRFHNSPEAAADARLEAGRIWRDVANYRGLEELQRDFPDDQRLHDLGMIREVSLPIDIEHGALGEEDLTAELTVLGAVATPGEGEEPATERQRQAISSQFWKLVDKRAARAGGWIPPGKEVALFTSAEQAMEAAAAIRAEQNRRNETASTDGADPIVIGLGISHGHVELHREVDKWLADGSAIQEATRLATTATRASRSLLLSGLAADRVAANGYSVEAIPDPDAPGRRVFALSAET